jgi:hypothetical protein
MLAKNDATRRARTKQPKRDTSYGDQVRKRLEAWRKAADRSREVDLEYICFLIHLEILDDQEAGWRHESRAAFLEAIRRRHIGPLGTRKLMVDPVSDLTERVPQALSSATMVDAETFEPDPAALQTSESIRAAFDYFGLNPDIPSHRGFFLAIVTDVYLNTPVPGRPKGTATWTRHRLLFLGAVLEAFKPEYPGATLTELAEAIRKALPADYHHENPDSFRKQLGKARRIFERLMQEDPSNASGWLLTAAHALDPENQEPRNFDSRSPMGN